MIEIGGVPHLLTVKVSKNSLRRQRKEQPVRQENEERMVPGGEMKVFQEASNGLR